MDRRIDAPAGSIPVNKERKGLLFGLCTPVVSRRAGRIVATKGGQQTKSTGYTSISRWLLFLVEAFGSDHHEHDEGETRVRKKSKENKDNNRIDINSVIE